MAKYGFCTNSAIQQMLVTERIQDMNTNREEEDIADSTEVSLSPPTKITPRRRSKISQHISTILDDDRFRARTFRRRSKENLQKLVWLRPAGQCRRKPQDDIIHEDQSTNNEHPQQPSFFTFSFFAPSPSKHSQPPSQRDSLPVGGLSPANSSTATPQKPGEILVDFSTSRRRRFSSKHSRRPSDTTTEHQSSKQPHRDMYPRQRQFSLNRSPSKPPKRRRRSFSVFANRANSSTDTPQKPGEMLVDFSTSQRRRFSFKHSRRPSDTTTEHQSSKQPHRHTYPRQRQFSLNHSPSKPPESRATSSTDTPQKPGEILVDFSTSRRRRFSFNHSRRPSDKTAEHQSSKQ